VITTFLLGWLIISYLYTFYDVVQPLVSKFNLNLGPYFSNDYDMKDAIFSGLPSNPYVIILGFIYFIVIEFLCHSPNSKTLETDKCDAWTVCYESYNSVQRIIGREKALTRAKEFILECEKNKEELIWVTTICSDAIRNQLLQCTNIVKSKVLIINHKMSPEEFIDGFPHDIDCKKIHINYNVDFLIRGDNEVLICTTSYNLRDTLDPFIIFITEDVFLIRKYRIIYNELFKKYVQPEVEIV